MLNHEVVGHVPVVEDLRAKDVTPNSPRRCIAFTDEPLEVTTAVRHASGEAVGDTHIMTDSLDVRIMNFKRAMMRANTFVLREEECMVICILLLAINV